MPDKIIPRIKADISDWSHIKIGDLTENLFIPEDYQQLLLCMNKIRVLGLTPLPLGAGSNILFGNTKRYALISDKHLPHFWKIDNGNVTVSANYNITQLIMELAKKNIGGLEFLAGIPAHLGGITMMNAGAYGYAIADFVSQVKLITFSGENLILSREEIEYGYRNSSISGFITVVSLSLPQKPALQIKKEVRTNILSRKMKQPLQYPNLGSVFKNPPNMFAGQLLEQAGFKGKAKGGVAFSDVHANFLININQGCFNDAHDLIEEARVVIRRLFNVVLETEIKVIDQ